MGIEELRAKIDELDVRIVALLNERARLAVDIGKIKRANRALTYAPDREEQVLRRVANANTGPLPAASLRSIYTEVISACRALERPVRVAFLGPEGTFAHQAVKRQFGSAAEYLPVNSISGVFAEVESERADHGVVPIENSSEGGVGETLDAFMESQLKICGEIQLRIHHNLMARSRDAQITRIYSKAEVLGQCRRWLAEHYPAAELKETASTTQAARLATAEPESAAIAHEEAARIYGLTILHANIEDNPHNATRFFVLGKTFGQPTGNDKTSILCFIKDEVGALVSILRPLSDSGINMTKIESWPSRRKVWDYCFFIDFDGHCEEEPVRRALAEVSRHCSQMKLLGSYPKAPTI